MGTRPQPESAPMGARPQILHILGSPRAEGTIKLDWMATDPARQDVFVLQSEPAEMTEQLGRRARWIRIDRALPRGPVKFPWLAWRTWRVCRERRPDLVICWPTGLSAFILPAARLAGVRRLVVHAGNPPTRTRPGLTHAVFTTRMVAAAGGRMICCSNYVAGEFARTRGVPRHILRAVGNCAAVEEIRAQAEQARVGRGDRTPRLVMVATLEAHKDHATLLRAMPDVVRDVPQARLWLVGEGSLRGRLESLRDSLGLADSVEFLGSRRDVPAVLGQCDGFVLSTTIDEGFGTVLIEAMAAGLPIVASDVPACREVLGSGRWGTLVPPGDPRALADAIVAILKAKDAAEGAERRAHLRQFAPSNMISAYVASTA